MAEQEACTALVDQATKGESTPPTPTTPTATGIEGESQLLPLLQGLLEVPQNDITPDSGTESGEDQRTNLIQEVQNALEKLSASLKSDQNDISSERKDSLLNLVSKLQAGLSGNDRRASTQSSGGRFHKRKNRQTRHTVGVSKEELAHARKLIEEISLAPSESLVTIPCLSKQNSESSVPTSSNNSSYKNIQQAKVKNAVAKPFSSSNSSSSAVDTPTSPFEAFNLLFGDDTDLTYYHPVSVQEKSVDINFPVESIVSSPPPNTLNRTQSVDSNASIKSAFAAVKKAALVKVSSMENTKEFDSPSETEDSSTIKVASNSIVPLNTNPIYTKPRNDLSMFSSIEEKSKRFDTNKRLRMKRANTIDIPKPLNFYHDDNESDTDHEHDLQKQHKDNYYALRGPIRVGNPNTKKIVPTFQPKTESDKKFLAFINKQNEGGDTKNAPWAKDNKIWGNKFGNIKNTFEKVSADDSLTSRFNSNQFGPKISRQSAKNLQQMFEEKQKENKKALPWSAQSNVVTGSLQLKTEPEKHYRVVPQPIVSKSSQPAPVNQFSHDAQSAFKPIPRKFESPSKRDSLILSPEGSEIVKSKITDTSGKESIYLYSPKPLDIPKQLVSPTITSPTTSKPWASNTAGGRVLNLASAKFEHPAQPEAIKPRKLSKDVQKAFTFTTPETTQKFDRTAPYLAKSSETKANNVRKLSGQYEDIQTKPTAQNYLINAQVTQKSFLPTYQTNANITQKHYTQPNTHGYPSQVQNYSIRYDQAHKAVPVHGYPNQNQKSFPQTTNYPTQPQNYSIRYDQLQKSTPISPQIQSYPSHAQNYSFRYDKPQKSNSISPQNQNLLSQSQKPTFNNTQTQNKTITFDESITQPQTYLIKYDQPTLLPSQSQNYSIRYDQPHSSIVKNPISQTDYQQSQNTSQVYQHVPGKDNTPLSPEKIRETEFTSNYEFKPQQKVSPMEQRPPKLQTQTSNESVQEYLAVSSKVMTGPVAQSATTVRQKSPMSRNEHDMEAALGLKNALQKVNHGDKTTSESFETKSTQNNEQKIKQSQNSAFAQVPSDTRSSNESFKQTSNSVKSDPPQTSDTFKSTSSQGLRTSFNSGSFKSTSGQGLKTSVHSGSFKFKSGVDENKNTGVVKPMQQVPNQIHNNVSKPREKLHINENGQSVVTGQFHIPIINVKSPEILRAPTQAKVLSKSDSWHQICVGTQKVGQKAPPSQQLVKSKSGHSLAVPKLFEAGMSKEEMLNKRKTMEAFLTGGKMPNEEKIIKKTSINRVKTSEKVSALNRGFASGLARSRTLPDMVVSELLDESNVDAAFEELFKSS